MAFSTFCGREAELSALQEAWARVASGGGPQVVVLLAESGLGKTRLTQEFYARLSAASGGGYWPGVLGQDGDSLRVNPVLEASGASGPMPWLWWGLRLPDPLSANSVGVGVLHNDHERYLRPHVEALRRRERGKQRAKEALKVGTGVLFDVAIDLVPLGGLTKTLGEAGIDLYRLYRENQQDQARAGADPSLTERVLDDLALALAARDGTAIPGTVLIDDAQFSHHDPGVVEFAVALCRRAAQESWPLLFLVTHWEKEWDAASPGSIAAHLRAMTAPPLAEVRMRPLSDLAPMLTAALPGLSEDQSRAILERADGNPRFLNEMILFAAGSRGLFEGRDTTRALTDRGLARLMEEGTGLHSLVASRLKASSEAVQEALCLASLQGMEFLGEVLGATARGLQADAGAVTDAVGEAETPHAYVSRFDPGVAAFAQRIYFEVAHEHLENCFDPEDARRVLEEVLRDITRNRFDKFSDEEQVRIMVLAAAVFEEAEPTPDRYIAASALGRLTQHAMAVGDWAAARRFADRLDRLIERSGDEVLDEDLEWLNLVYMLADGSDARDTQERVLKKRLRLTSDAYQEDVNGWTAWMLARTLLVAGDHRLDRGDPEGAGQHLGRAREVLDQWGIETRTAEELIAWFDLHGLCARLLLHLDLPAEAREHAEAQIRIVEAMDGRSSESDPDAASHARHLLLLTTAAHKAGILALRIDDRTAARAHFEMTLAACHVLIDNLGVPSIRAKRVSALTDYSRLLELEGEAARAGELLTESLAQALALAHTKDSAEHRRLLAAALWRSARMARLQGRLEDARQMAHQALALYDRDAPDGPVAEGELPRLYAELAEQAQALGDPGEALTYAARSRDQALTELNLRPSSIGRGRLLQALALLAEAQQELGRYRDAASTLDEGEALVRMAGPVDRAEFAPELERLTRAREAQPDSSCS